MEAKIGILTVSDTRSEETDVSGKSVEESLRDLGLSQFTRKIVKDEVDAIAEAIVGMCADCQMVVTTGGTGFSPRDVTPEATLRVLDKRADNLSDLMRTSGARSTPYAYLSRGICGVRGRTLIMNLPGSPRAVVESLEAVGH